jgi:hypothetical protein
MTDTITAEIEKLTTRLNQLHAEKEAIDAIRNDTSLDNSISRVREGVESIEDKVEKDIYSRSCVVSKFQDRQNAPIIRDILRSLEIINNRLKSAGL